jgi:hypothetical protein
VWDVVLDLSAPKLLIPDNFEDKQAPIIVVDFGKFLLTNQKSQKTDATTTDEAPDHTRFDNIFQFCLSSRLLPR